MTKAAAGSLLALSLAAAVTVAAQAADEIKSGKWEFTTQMQLPGQSAPAGQAAGRNAPMTRTPVLMPPIRSLPRRNARSTRWTAGAVSSAGQ